LAAEHDCGRDEIERDTEDEAARDKPRSSPRTSPTSPGPKAKTNWLIAVERPIIKPNERRFELALHDERGNVITFRTKSNTAQARTARSRSSFRHRKQATNWLEIASVLASR